MPGARLFQRNRPVQIALASTPAMADDNHELAALRSNADNLSKCLHALLERIESLEGKSPRSREVTQNDTSVVKHENGHDGHNKKDEQVEISDTVSVDPVTGLKKRTIVTERVLTTKTFHALSLDPTPSIAPISNGRILSPGYQARAVHIDAKQLNQIEVETISGQLVVTRVNAAANHDIHPGDTITHVNGRGAVDRNALSGLNGKITLTLVPAAIHSAPSVFYRVNADYNSDFDESRICRWLSIDVKKGDVVQIMSQDDNWIQARKVNDLSRVGYLPASLSKEKVAMLCPFGRRVLVLLGAVGVGRRTIKSMLLHAAPQYFATVVPRKLFFCCFRFYYLFL
ncbi:Guanylate kinase domain-containing protein [Trichostrongylus colubriformis]|uniref:Guanylate kinase domain-containing protein n=1 Tax=Trichostrongylus colubriformis TaxID=6319 RepID=A0AAN8ESY0_TRICO